MALHLDNAKLRTLEEAVQWRQSKEREGRRVVLTNGVFDLLHTGHLHFLQDARQQGEALVVAINGDASVKALKGPQRPIVPAIERAYALAALSCVDAIVIFHEPRLVPEIEALQPDVYCKAGDYTLEKLHAGERQALQQAGSEIVFLPFLEGFSTTRLIARIQAAGSI